MIQFAALVRLVWIVAALSSIAGGRAEGSSALEKYLGEISAPELVKEAEAYGPVRDDIPVAPLLRGGETIGYAYLTTDFVGATGYSGKPIHVLAAISPDATLLGAELAHHSEPIVLIGIPDRKIKTLTESYAGLDLAQEAAERGSAHDLKIISGATVTVMVIDDSIVRSGIKVARALGLGGMASAETSGPSRQLDMSPAEPSDWTTLSGDGSVRRLSLDVGQINRAFEASDDPRAAERPEKGAPEETFIDLNAALVSAPEIGRTLLGDSDYANLTGWLQPGEHAILVMGRGHYSFKGSGYVRGGIFDRIQLIQGDHSVRFRDKDHRRLVALAPPDAPRFVEADVFRISADSEFDPAEPWRLQLLVQRAVGAVEKTFLTFDLDYRLPERFLLPAATTAAPPLDGAAAQEDEAAAQADLWRRVWEGKTLQIAVLLGMLGLLTGVFFFQRQATRNERAYYWFRMGFLAVTLIFLGWMENAQLSVVNLMALGASLREGFSWSAFLLDPLVFILWFSVAAALLFWGRGAYCGWLCPFGALQELTNQIGRAFRIPQVTLPWGLHERLWPFKYILFLGLFGLSMVSIAQAEHYAEVEPFKTAIILKFMRDWPFVAFALALLIAGLFIERFYCRYLCPLGAALAIPGRLRMFDWLKRYHECGNPCQLCANECFVQAIHPTGEINPNECLSCLHCQVLYQDDQRCPVCIKKRKRREHLAASAAPTRQKQENNHV